MIVTFVRTLILLLFVIVFTRLMGKRQIGQLQPFEFVIAILMADMVAWPMQDTGLPLIQGIIPIVALYVAHNLITYLNLKGGFFRLLFCGRPSVLIEKGKVNLQELKKMSISINDLMENLRLKNSPRIEDILYATLETNGEISVILKSRVSPVTNQSAGIQVEETGRPLAVVIDGKADKKNMQLAKIKYEDLLQSLNKMGLESEKDILFAAVDDLGNIYVQEKNSGKTLFGKIKTQGE